ncbi:MAG: TetR/AcrR family transcriptional regulator [Myxococcales bacterium]|nr:TetR/AcrR family transcriptional regulator [Myxococcales bacterium]MDD9971114.1 TetR/AcrR family transcriptional regulator [Myxococcales bacterium]
MSPNLRDKHAAATRRALVRSARTLFAKHGYEATGIDQIAAHAGATRGAVYHHFAGKRELLRATLDELQGALAKRVAIASAGEADPQERTRKALATFLDACVERKTARILLEDAPAVLGWDVWRELDAQHFLGMTEAAIRDLVTAGHLPAVDPEILAHLWMGALTEAALLLVRNPGPDTRARVDAALEVMVGPPASRSGQGAE